MPRPPFSQAILGAVLIGCAATPPSTPTMAPVPAVAAAPAPVHLAWAEDDRVVVVMEGPAGCFLERRDLGGSSAGTQELPFCPSSVRQSREGTLLLASDSSALLRAGGEIVQQGALLDWREGVRLEPSTGGVRFHPSGEIAAVPGELRDARLIGGGRAVVHVREAAGDSLVRLEPGASAETLAGPFEEIDSFDVAPDGTDAVFSARRDGGYDVGLIATGGGEIRWIPADPLDERMVSWAPRGNKVTYGIDAPAGSVLRTVHIPTGFQLSVPVGARVRGLAWEPRAERFVVRVGSAGSADRVEVLRYGGEERRTLVPASARIDAEEQPLAGVPGAVVFAPNAVRYDEKLPVVVWLEESPAIGWSEPRARVHQNRRTGTVVVPAGAADDASLWEAIRALGWADASRIYVVSRSGAERVAREIPAAFDATVVTRGSGRSSSGRSVIVGVGGDPFDAAAASWLEQELGRAGRP